MAQPQMCSQCFTLVEDSCQKLSTNCLPQEEAFKQQQEAQLTFSNRAGHGVAEKRPEDSVYYHPTLNPEGIPPPGKPQVRASARRHARACGSTLRCKRPAEHVVLHACQAYTLNEQQTVLC